MWKTIMDMTENKMGSRKIMLFVHYKLVMKGKAEGLCKYEATGYII